MTTEESDKIEYPFHIFKGKVKEGDIVRYPIGFTLSVKRVYADNNRDLYVKQSDSKNTPLYIYKQMDGYKWDTRLFKQRGFRLANKNELKYLEP